MDMITINMRGITVEIDPTRFSVELDDDLAQALANELNEYICTALAHVRDRKWTAGHDCDGVWRLVEMAEALQSPDWAARAIRT